jgi:hypothetical protein
MKTFPAAYQTSNEGGLRAVRAAIYARVSTLNGQNPEIQLNELRAYALRRGWQLVGEYVDTGISGAKDSRPELNRLMADAHRPSFDVVCVWKFDRFARSVSHLLRALETFKALGIEFCSYSEQMDTSTPAGKMIFTVLGAGRIGAQFDRRAGPRWATQCSLEGQEARAAFLPDLGGGDSAAPNQGVQHDGSRGYSRGLGSDRLSPCESIPERPQERTPCCKLRFVRKRGSEGSP